MLLNAKERRDIGLEYIFENLETMTPFGDKRKSARRIYRPGQEEELKEELRASLFFTQALEDKAYSLNDLRYEFCRLKDISGSIMRASRGASLDEVELFEIKGFSRVVGDLIKKIEGLPLPQGFEIKELGEVERLLDPDGTGLLTFYIYDSYSPRLEEIREEKKALEEKIYRAKKKDQELLLEKRGLLVLEEEDEERRVRKVLSQALAEKKDLFFHNMEALGKLDHWLAKARLSHRYGYTMPEIKGDMELHIKEATSPLMVDLLRKDMRSFQSLTIDLLPGTTIVTGANMGGKSVSLKTLLLNVLLVHLGMLPFASSMSLGLMDFVFYMGDDYEDVGLGLSSFGAEIIRLRDIFSRAKKERGLMVLDEPARGTNPREGRAIVKGIANYFLARDSILLMATHFDQVVEEGMVHYQIRGFQNVDFERLKSSALFKGNKSMELLKDQMDYRLERVVGEREVPRDALKICSLLGLEEELIDSINHML